MKLLLGVCLLVGIAWDISAAAALQGSVSAVPQSGSGEHRAERAAGGNGQTNNMTVGFVPLISIIANLLPRFFNRYATVPPANVQQARSLDQHRKYVECQKSDQIGLKWPDQFSGSHYYQCHRYKYCSKTERKGASCLVVKRHHCQLNQVFNIPKQKCL